MDPTIVAAVLGPLGVVVAAWIASGRTHGAVKRIESEFSPNGGSSTKDALNRIENAQRVSARDLAHLTGRFDQHVDDTAAAHEEGITMWRAVEAVAKTTPPTEEI